MPVTIDNYLSTQWSFEQVDEIMEKYGLWEKMCIKDKNTPIKTGKTGSFIGIPDEHGGYPVLRCPSYFDCKDIPQELMEMFKDLPFKFNIVKIQKYEKGIKGISPHADKVIDMDVNHPIYIYRINKEPKKYRSLCFCIKEGEGILTTYKLPSNSLVEISYEENLRLLHWVPVENDKDTTSQCISFVFRLANTFQLRSGHVYGQGALFKSYEERMTSPNSGNHEGLRAWGGDLKPEDLRKNNERCIKMFNLENKTDLFNTFEGEKEKQAVLDYRQIRDEIIELTL